MCGCERRPWRGRRSLERKHINHKYREGPTRHSYSSKTATLKANDKLPPYTYHLENFFQTLLERSLHGRRDTMTERCGLGGRFSLGAIQTATMHLSSFPAQFIPPICTNNSQLCQDDVGILSRISISLATLV